jgi:HK97 family phage portal protein
MMGLIDKLEKRASKGGEMFLQNPDRFALQLFGGNEASSGAEVTTDSALEWTALAAAIRIMTNTIAGLPLNVYMRRADGGKDIRREHPLHPILHDSPNREQTAFEFRSLVITHGILWGNFFAEIVRKGGVMQELWPLNPDRVRVERKAGQVRYLINLDSKTVELAADRILHIPGFVSNGLVGRSLVRDHKEAIGLGLATEIFGARFYGKGLVPSGHLQHPETLSVEAQKRLKQQIEAAHGGLEQSHRLMVLEEGMKWQQIAVDPEKAQALGMRAFQLKEAVRIVTGVPPHLIGDLDRATFSNIEQQSIEFIQYGLQPWITKIEQRVKTQLFTENERNSGLFAEHQIQGLMRGDSAARQAFYMAMLDRGVFNINEVRSFENLNPIPDGDVHLVNLNLQPLERALEEPPEPNGGESPDEANLSKPTDAEVRSPLLRLQLIQAFEQLFRDASTRMVGREVNQIRRAAKRLLTDGNPQPVQAFLEWLRRFYFDDFPDEIRKIMAPVFAAYSAQMAMAAGQEVGETPNEEQVRNFTDSYTTRFVNRHAKKNRTELEELVEQAEDPAPVLEEQLTRWEDGYQDVQSQAEQVASRELHQLGNGIARTVFVGAGVLALVWRNTGAENCPTCEALEGRVVGAADAFVNEGEQVEGITAGAQIRHPPIHGGCDCQVMPG